MVHRRHAAVQLPAVPKHQQYSCKMQLRAVAVHSCRVFCSCAAVQPKPAVMLLCCVSTAGGNAVLWRTVVPVAATLHGCECLGSCLWGVGVWVLYNILINRSACQAAA
jgi:hypothetical protein